MLLNNSGTFRLEVFLFQKLYSNILKKETAKVLFVPLQIYNENYYG